MRMTPASLSTLAQPARGVHHHSVCKRCPEKSADDLFCTTLIESPSPHTTCARATAFPVQSVHINYCPPCRGRFTRQRRICAFVMSQFRSFDVEQNTHPLPLLFCYHQDHEMLSPALTGNPVEQLKNRVVRITEPATKVRLLSTTHVSCFCLSPVRPTIVVTTEIGRASRL